MNEFLDRRTRLRSNMPLTADAAYLTADLPTVRYLTGFTGSNAAVLIGHDSVYLVTDGRYRDQAAQECPGVEVVIERDIVAAVTSIRTSDAHLLLDDRAPWSLAQRLPDSGYAIESVHDPVGVLRMVKEPGEIDHLRAACRITAQALADVATGIAVGDREVDIARGLEARFAELGAEDRAFPSIVAGGANSAVPHHRASEYRLEVGDLLVVDCGARYRGYHADMTRTFVVGAQPANWQREIHDLVLEAQAAGTRAIQSGVVACEVDRAARGVIDSAGRGEAFTHGTGHGVGLQIHEAPLLSATSEAILEAGNVVTVEPGVYLPDRGGVRIEDTVIVGESAQVLTEMDRDLVRVG